MAHHYQTVPAKAGSSSLLSKLRDGNVVILQSRAGGKTLRSYHGTAQGVGGFGAHAQWIVHVRRQGVIALQNQHTSTDWLAIHNGQTIGNGRGGPYCEFIVLGVDGHVVLESVQYRGQHVGVLPSGGIKDPGKTGTGQHAQFILNVHKSIKFEFVGGSVVILESCASGKTLRSLHGKAEGIGGRGAHAQWKVHVRRPGVIALQNQHTPSHWLAIRDGATIGNAQGGPYCEFIVKESDENVVLESVQYRGQHVGVLPSGEIREPGRTGTGQHAQFRLIQHKKPEEVGYDVSRHMAGLNLSSSILSLFAHGNVVILESRASGKTLRSCHGTAEGIGGRGAHAQWKVNTRGPGIIALQNQHTPSHWLAIRDGATIGNAGGGPYCEFKILTVNDNVVLESTQYPGQHVGVRPDGTIKPPGQTGTGNHAQFKPILHQQAHPTHAQPHPPPNPAYPPAAGYPPPPPYSSYPHQPPVPGYPTAPPPAGYPTPAGYPWHPPAGGYPGQWTPWTGPYNWRAGASRSFERNFRYNKNCMQV